MLDKKISKLYLILSIVIFCLIVGFLVYSLFFKKTTENPPVIPEQKTVEELLQGLTAPAESEARIPNEVLKSLAAPSGKGEVSREILKNLTAPK